jgi:hypothetical protein
LCALLSREAESGTRFIVAVLLAKMLTWVVSLALRGSSW